MKPRNGPLYFLLLSAVAGVLLLVIFLFSHESANTARSGEKTLVSAAFLVSCLLCLSMTISPNWITRALGRPSKTRSRGEPGDAGRGFRGHHPDCDKFDDHRLSIGGRTLCSGCLGLMIGATASVALILIYVIIIGAIQVNVSLVLLVVGFCAVSFAFAEASTRKRIGFVHLLANALMVIGFLSLVVAMMSVGGLVPGILAVAFSYLWIDTRIELSLWRHSQVCSECPQMCKMY